MHWTANPISRPAPYLLPFLLFGLFVLSGCEEPASVPRIVEARSQWFEATAIGLDYRGYFYNAQGRLDSIYCTLDLRKRTEPGTYPFDYVVKRLGEMEYVYLRDSFLAVNYLTGTVTRYGQEDIRQRPQLIRNNVVLGYSPMNILREELGPWQVVGDTLLGKEAFLHLVAVETDTFIQGNHILSQRHLWLDEQNLPRQFERRAFYNEQPSRTIRIVYQNLKLDFDPTLAEKLTYRPPEGFTYQTPGN